MMMEMQPKTREERRRMMAACLITSEWRVWCVPIGVHIFNVENEECLFSPKKRAPGSAKNKHGRGTNYPFRIGEECEVDIVDTDPNGGGIARIKGYPIFISNAKPNEHLKIRITNLISGCAEAQINT